MHQNLTHPCLKHHDLIKDLCTPLEKLGVTFFGYTALDSMNNGYCLGSKINYAEQYLVHNNLKKDILFDPKEHKTQPDYFFWDFQKLDQNQKQLYQMAAQFNQSHTLSITQHFNDMSHSFHFSGENSDDGLNQRLLEKMDCIHAFIDMFKDKLNAIDELAEIYQYATAINVSEIYPSTPSKLIKENPRLLNLNAEGQHILNFTSATYLSKNERNCLKWLKLGKSAQSIAEINQVSRKTIDRYVRAIKEKFECYTLFQIGMHIEKEALTDFLN